MNKFAPAGIDGPAIPVKSVDASEDSERATASKSLTISRSQAESRSQFTGVNHPGTIYQDAALTFDGTCNGKESILTRKRYNRHASLTMSISVLAVSIREADEGQHYQS